MFRDFLEKLGFTRKCCEGCLNKDYMIQILNERLREAEKLKEAVTFQVIDINRHLLRMDKVEKKEDGEVRNVRVPKVHNPIQTKLQQAERMQTKKADDEGLTEKRKREYDERLKHLEKEMQEDNKAEEVH